MNTTKALGFPKLALSLASCIFILSIHVVGEKGDTITALMTAKDLPPDTGFVPPTGKVSYAKCYIAHQACLENAASIQSFK